MKVTNIVVTHKIHALHHWPDIPPDHPMQFLKYPHRHEFHIQARFAVGHSNRQREFLVEKQRLIDAVNSLTFFDYNKVRSFGSLSCEQIAEQIMDLLSDAYYVSVMEDGENGAEVSAGQLKSYFEHEEGTAG